MLSIRHLPKFGWHGEWLNPNSKNHGMDCLQRTGLYFIFFLLTLMIMYLLFIRGDNHISLLTTSNDWIYNRNIHLRTDYIVICRWNGLLHLLVSLSFLQLLSVYCFLVRLHLLAHLSRVQDAVFFFQKMAILSNGFCVRARSFLMLLATTSLLNWTLVIIPRSFLDLSLHF